MSLFSKKSRPEENSPYLIIIAGCAGSGKTTVGKELAKQLGFSYVDKDTVTRDYTDFILTRSGSFEGDRESDLYKEQILPIEYHVTFKVCREILENGSSVVLTIPFIGQIRDMSKWLSIKEKARISDDVIVKFIWIKHDINTEKKNILKRGASRDAYKLSHWDEYADSVEGIEPSADFNAYIYVNDCEAKLADTLVEVRQWIKK